VPEKNENYFWDGWYFSGATKKQELTAWMNTETRKMPVVRVVTSRGGIMGLLEV
jgi:hypothetical protein